MAKNEEGIPAEDRVNQPHSETDGIDEPAVPEEQTSVWLEEDEEGNSESLTYETVQPEEPPDNNNTQETADVAQEQLPQSVTDKIVWQSPWKAEKKVPPPWGVDLQLKCEAEKITTTKNENINHTENEKPPKDEQQHRRQNDEKNRISGSNDTNSRRPPKSENSPETLREPPNILFRGELLLNNGYNKWNGDHLIDWETNNVTQTGDALTGTRAVSLGLNPEQEAYVYQDIIVVPGHCYELKGSFSLPGDNSAPPEIMLLWLDAERQTIGEGLVLRLTPHAKPHYQHITHISDKSPGNAVYARLFIKKPGRGVLRLDTVSLIYL